MQGHLIPARFLTLIGHLCIVITLLWESEQSVQHCLPTEFHESHLKLYQKKLIGGFGASIALIGLELITFLTGITMFSPTTALVSTGCHGMASIILAYFILDSWQCGWFWFIFVFCSVFPFLVDILTVISCQFLISPSRVVIKIVLTDGIPFIVIYHKNEQHISSGSWTPILIIAGISTTFGSSLPVGYNIGVINTPANIIKGFCNESFISRYNVTLTESSLGLLWSSIVSIFIVGGMIGSLLGALIADNVGRKGGIILVNFMSLLGAIFFVISYPSNSVEMLFIGRFLVGLSGGLTTSIIPMYLIELAPVKLRGAMGVLCPLGVTFGVLAGQILSLDYILGSQESWHYLLGFFGVQVIIFTPIIFFLPESPKFLLIVKSDMDKAIESLCRIRNKSQQDLEHDIAELSSESNSTRSNTGNKWGLWDVLTMPDMRLALMLVCFMQAGQQTSGINAVFYYSHFIFTGANLTDEVAQLATIGAGVINCVMAILAIPLMHYCNRRPLAIVSTACSTIFLIILCATIQNITSVPYMPKLCIAVVCLYVCFYGLGLGPLPYFIGSELFEVDPRPAAMALGSLCNWGGNFLVGMTFGSLNSEIGPYSFLLFALSTGLLSLFIYFYLPETKGKSPAEAALLCRRGYSLRPVYP